MRKLLLTLVAVTVMASSAHAVGGIDLSVNACPGNPGALGDVIPIDCASGTGVVILGTWAPAENITDLVALDGFLDLYVGVGLDTAGFWDFDPTGCNPVDGSFGYAVSTSQHRTRTGCAAPVEYTDTWAADASGAGVSAYYPHGVRTNSVSLSFTCYRGAPVLSVGADQMLFGMQLIVDGHNATEAGGLCNGCPQMVSLLWQEARPKSWSGNLPTIMFNPTGHFPGFGNCIGLNGSADCSAVPTVKRTWGQLKSLYR